MKLFLGKFTEDGSFIGQYGPGNEKKKLDEQPTLSSVATYVWFCSFLLIFNHFTNGGNRCQFNDL